MLQSYMLTYNHLRNYLEIYSFKFNPYDPYVANKIIKGGSIRVVFNVDDVKSSHKEKNVVENFE